MQSRGKARKIATMMFKSAEKDRAFVEKCLVFSCSLDSGAFTTAIPRGLLRKLRDRVVSLEQSKLDEPMQIDEAVVGSTCIAESSTHLTLRLYTTVDPILLRGLRVSVILECMPAILVERYVLKELGIDPEEMLTTKLSEGLFAPYLDVSSIPSIFSESGMKSISLDEGQDQHKILTEGGYSHTLTQSYDYDSDDWIETDEIARGDMLQDALEGMIERAGRVLDTEQKPNSEIWSMISSMSRELLSL